MYQTAITIKPVSAAPPRREKPSQHERAAHSGVAENAERRLKSSPHAALRSITCEVEDDALVLRGRVMSFYLKQLAQETVRTIDGVGLVINVVEVMHEPNRSS
jgi:osmotically-inducible protein OsmY